MTAAKVVPLHQLKAGSRPEIGVLAQAVGAPMNLSPAGFPVITTGNEFAVLPLGYARDLLDLIEDLCAHHLRCEACGEDVACAPCGLGDPDTWCLTHGICPACVSAGSCDCTKGVS